jgi:hypothetical protein
LFPPPPPAQLLASGLASAAGSFLSETKEINSLEMFQHVEFKLPALP